MDVTILNISDFGVQESSMGVLNLLEDEDDDEDDRYGVATGSASTTSTSKGFRLNAISSPARSCSAGKI